VGLESAVAIANADLGELGYLTNTSSVASSSRFRKPLTWTSSGRTPPGATASGDERIQGRCVQPGARQPHEGHLFRCVLRIIFGNWSELLIGEWGCWS
jgi:hypothetical protein